MRSMFALRVSVPVLLSAVGAFAAPARGGPPPVVVVFDASANALPQAEIRSAIAKQLQREVQSEPSDALGQLYIRRDSNGRLLVQYQPPQSELERTLPLPDETAQLPLVIALVAQNLVSGEAGEMIAELDAANRAHPTGSLAPEQTGSVARQPERTVSAGPYFRLSLGAGYGSGVYSNDDASPMSIVGISGLSIGARVAGGFMSTSGLALGLEASLFSDGPLRTRGVLGQAAMTTLDEALVTNVQVFTDLYPERKGPLHVQAGVGASCGAFGYAAITPLNSGTSSNSVVVPPVWGPSGYFGTGYDFKGAGGWGLFVRGDAAYLLESHSSYTPVDLQLGITMSWF